jgi:hypothetical protein
MKLYYGSLGFSETALPEDYIFTLEGRSEHDMIRRSSRKKYETPGIRVSPMDIDHDSIVLYNGMYLGSSSELILIRQYISWCRSIHVEVYESLVFPDCLFIHIKCIEKSEIVFGYRLETLFQPILISMSSECEENRLIHRQEEE